MNFREGLNYVYKNRSSDLELTDPFVLYCKLSDLCSSSFEDKHKVVLFYQIDKKINVVQSILNNDFDVITKYSEVKDLLREESFIGLVNTVKKVLDSNYQEKKEPKLQKKASPQPADQKAVVQKIEEPEVEETRTPLVNSYSSSDNSWIIGLSVIGGILFAMVLLIIFACVFNWGWTFWQWFIGIAGDVVLFAIISTSMIELDDNGNYGTGSILLGIFVLINFILLLIFREKYKIIFGCLSVLEISCGLLFIFPAFDDCEEGWGIVRIVETVLALILFIVALIWL